MANLQRMFGRVRGLSPGNGTENREDEQLNIAPDGSSLFCDALPNRSEIVRLGDSWQQMGGAFAAVTYIPTTAGGLTLWNGEPGNGKVYVIDSIAATKVLIDATTNDYFTIWGQIIRSPMTAPTDAAIARVSLCGKSNYSGRARNVATSTTVSGRWDMLGSSQGLIGAAAIAGGGWEQVDIDLYGRYIITPGAAFTMHVSEITATANAFRFTMRWHEIQIPYNA